MLKGLGIGALAALIALGTLSITEAASSDREQNAALCCRGSYCYNQNDNNGNRAGDCYNDGYCERGRDCW